MPGELPIDDVLGELLAALDGGQCAALQAMPGAGKTTRVPWALYQQRPDDPEQVVITEPRRLAARLAATFVAHEQKQRLGDLVGYSVRFDDKSSNKTRIRYVTEGILLQRLRSDPELSGIRAVILDEFHERHQEGDELLARLWLLTAQRPEFKLVVMSATLDIARVSALLGNCPRITSPGRTFPLTIEHDTELEDGPLEKRVSLAVKKALRRTEAGHVLVFLPGMFEINRVSDQLSRSQDLGAIVLPLHGDLPLDAQARAVEATNRRKVVLSTNVAESSVTIDGVTAVVDTGLARVASVSPWTGQRAIRVEPVSRDSLTQRAGRAGRTGPGHVIRLFSEGSARARPEAATPEIARSDLTDLALGVYGSGHRPRELPWLDPPPDAALNGAETLLERLGALEAIKGGFGITKLGQEMLATRAPPRIARALLEGRALGIASTVALAAALLSESDIRQRRLDDNERRSGLSDVQDRIDTYDAARASDFAPQALRAMGLKARAVSEVRRAANTWRDGRSDDSKLSDEEVEERLRRALLAGFPDCVARRKRPDGNELILSNGSHARLSAESVVHQAEFLVALGVEERAGSGPQRTGAGTVAMAQAIDPNWLLDDYGKWVQASDEFTFNAQLGRVEVKSKMSYGSVTLEEARSKANPCSRAGQTLFEALQGALGRNEKLTSIEARVALLQNHGFTFSAVPDALNLLRQACENCVTRAEVEELDLSDLFVARLSAQERSWLNAEAPETVTLPSGRRLTVHYEPGRPPWVASRLQDFFGMRESPTLGRRQSPLTLHLLAPNQRAVQVTSDLAGFWARHYAEVRKELRRRYPRHPWPEDGATASPPPPKPPHKRS